MERATTGQDDISDFIFCIVTVALRVVLRSVPSTPDVEGPLSGGAGRATTDRTLFMFTQTESVKPMHILECQDTDCRYLEEPGAFNCSYVKAWPTPSNLFINRAGVSAAVGSKSKHALADFTQFLSGAVSAHQTDVLTFEVELEVVDGQVHVASELVARVKAGMPPITADNAGFFEYAMNWCATHKPKLILSVTGPDLFWIHC